MSTLRLFATMLVVLHVCNDSWRTKVARATKSEEIAHQKQDDGHRVM
jgi:hypothetical protein